MKPLEIDSCLAIIYSIILFSPIIICLIFHYNRIIPAFLEILKELRSSHYWKSLLKIQIICIFIVGALLMAQTFNGFAPHFTSNTFISRNMSDWGDFATCLTAIFTLISIFYAYRAFRSQAISTERSLTQARFTLNLQSKATMRASFDATFTQIFSQHKVLHDKVMQHNSYIRFYSNYDIALIVGHVTNNIFSICKKEYRKSETKSDVSLFWNDFNERIGVSISIDFKNYFKYIYHEVNIVVSQPNDVLDEDSKRRYIQLIQAQMNYDELFCYLINQVEYLSRFDGDNGRNEEMAQRARRHAANLKEYGFFYELCKSRSGHVELIKRIFGLSENDSIPKNNSFINNSWFFVPRDENR